ncbi:hypothetical protein B0H11DRAFT_1911833 [Mycena galericulata]|nr:hypothetical protein B0H11DRAFT_1911833 [Mycena galericulata]
MTQFNTLFNFLGCIAAPAVGCGTPVVQHFPAAPFQTYWPNSCNEFNRQRQSELQMCISGLPWSSVVWFKRSVDYLGVYTASEVHAALGSAATQPPCGSLRQFCGNFFLA